MFSSTILDAKASHMLGGEIRYSPTEDPFTYEIEVFLFSNLNSPADRPEIFIDFGDGVTDTIPRTLITDYNSEAPCATVRLSQYLVTHTYSEEGAYVVRFVDQNRSSGIINIPNSNSQSFCVEAVLMIDQALGPNTSIAFDTLQFKFQRNWNALIHEPGAFDADGDSLAFELVQPNGHGCFPINGYQYPEGANYTWLEPTTGTYIWDYPTVWGEFVIAIRGTEYRNGQLIGQVTRDMTICVVGFIAGLDDAGPFRSLTIAPNLTNDLIWIENPSSSPIPTWIHDARGKLVLSQTLGSGRSSIDLGQFPTGAYIVSATSATGQRFSGRVMKQ
ncbi:MAG: T9SS type A sorting domain-containing protein [Flavobacteriales bacterium]|nr:T9SS type A sorting domain-containing protein [Flavobacteriales bacterium]